MKELAVIEIPLKGLTHYESEEAARRSWRRHTRLHNTYRRAVSQYLRENYPYLSLDTANFIHFDWQVEKEDGSLINTYAQAFDILRSFRYLKIIKHWKSLKKISHARVDGMVGVKITIYEIQD